MNPETERGNWTSASSAGADALCPGRHQAQLGLPETTSEEAKAGREIHAWLHWKRSGGVSVDIFAHQDQEWVVGEAPEDTEPVCDYELAARCWQLEQKAVADWLARLPKEAEQYELEVMSEQRLWMEITFITKLEGGPGFGHVRNTRLRHSGQPDGVYRKGRWACIRDSKSGWLEVVPPNSNEQLRDLAVLVFVNSPLALLEIEVGIDQPGADKQPPCVYDREALKTARVLLEQRVIASNDPEAKRIPGEVQCRFCKAKGTSRCPESSLSVVAVPQMPLAEIPDAKLLEACLLAEPIIRAVKERARAALKANPDAIPGFKLEPNAPNKPISDPAKFWERCSEQGVTLNTFMGWVKVGKGDAEEGLKEIIRAKTGQKRVTGFGSLWLKLLDGITKEEPKEPSVVRIK